MSKCLLIKAQYAAFSVGHLSKWLLWLVLANKEKKMFVGPLRMVQRFQVGKAYINVYKLQPRAGRLGD